MNGYFLDNALVGVMEFGQDENRGEELPRISTYKVAVGNRTLWGLFNTKTLELVCEPKFTEIGEFVNGVASCKVGKRVGFVKEDGTLLVDPDERFVGARDMVADMCFLRTKEGKWKLFSKSRNAFVEGEYDSVDTIVIESANKTVFRVWKGCNCGIVRNDGTWQIQVSPKGLISLCKELVIARAKDGKLDLINLVSEKVLLTGVTEINKDGNYVSYYTQNAKYALIKLEDGDKRFVVDGYDGYEVLTANLVKCYANVNGKRLVDICNVTRRFVNITVRNVAIRAQLKGLDKACWEFEATDGLRGIFDYNGRQIIRPIATDIKVVSPYLLKVWVNDLVGIYDCYKKDWLVLPQYLDVVGPDPENGSFRVAQEISKGRFVEKVVKVWGYINYRGIPITQELFTVANSFKKGMASVKTLDGVSHFLCENGKLYKS